MFEFTEDKKSIRPKYVGTIKSNWKRRAAMCAMLLPTIAVCILYNWFGFFLVFFYVLYKQIIIGTMKPLLSPFHKWELWDKPREPK